MPRTPDEFPGERIEESILLLSGSEYPVQPGEFTYVAGVGFVFGQDDGNTLIRSGNLNEVDHSRIRQLAHFIDDGPSNGFLTGAYKETLPFASPFPTMQIWWTSAAKVEKVLQLEVTRSGIYPVTESWKLFSGSTVVETLTDVITYSGAFETTRARTMT